MLDFIAFLATLVMFLFILCMIETVCFFNTEINFVKNTNIHILFELVRKIARYGQKKSSFDGQDFFSIIKEVEILDSDITIKELIWKIWVPIWVRTIIYKCLEYIEYIFKKFGLKNSASVVHFVLQLFRIQCVYDLKKLSKKESIIRILQIALNLGQLEGKLGIILPFRISCFITANIVKIKIFSAALIKKKLIKYDQLSSK
jgi:hypothetical protein